MSESLMLAGTLIQGIGDDGRPIVVEQGALYQKDGVIQDIGKADDLIAQYPQARRFGSMQHVLMPGFVNSHHHVGLTPLQLGSPDYALELWFASRMGAREVDLRLDTLYSAFEMIASGITTVQHIHGWRPGTLETIHDAAGAVLAAYREIGMRASYSFAVREQNLLVYDADEQFVARVPADIQPQLAAHLKKQRLPLDDHLKLFRMLAADNQGQSLTRIQLAPANLHWCGDEALQAIKAEADNAGVPMHMHLVETAYQREYARRRTGGTALAHLHKLGLLGPSLTLGHGVWLNEADIELAAATGTCVCHNCSSNLRLRSGVAPLNAFRRHGLVVGLGLDEAGINEDRDMLQEMRLALRVHRVPGMDDDEVPSCAEIVRMATEGGARTTPFAGQIGRLEPGKLADAVLFDWQSITWPYQDEDIPLLDVLVQRARARDIESVFIQGEEVCHRGQFTRVNRTDVLNDIAQKLAAPRTADEQARRELGKAVFPHVKDFYRDYLAAETPREPFYAPSSRR
ncbi:amidohydrolase family protein [Acerihabitans arboris]|uniref:Amidohydrolase family protein n=1 Tax=Acerihabitans arboris TaxID=2691583 RepID=A0A845SMC4_9GAMM|nr:amidohydrolase family protein [Acerihabitans arboris]NDL65149.1 amidohydrolase family protein [Acerihabitans arboris]